MFNILGSIGDIIKKSAETVTNAFGGSSTTPTQTVQNITKGQTPQVTPAFKQTPTQMVQSVTNNVTPQVTKVPVQSYGLNDILKGQVPQQSPITISPQNQTVIPQSELNRSRIESSRVTDTLATPENYIKTYLPELFTTSQLNKAKEDTNNTSLINLNKTPERINKLINFADVGISTGVGAVEDFSKRFVDMLDNFDANNPAPLSKKIGSIGSVAAGTAGLIPSWLAFNVVLNGIRKDSPEGETVAKAIDYPVEKIMGVGSVGISKVIDVLPISQEAKDNIRGPAEELAGLMAIILAGHATPAVIKRANELRKTVQDKVVTTYKESTPAQRQGGYVKFGKTIEKNMDKLPENLRNQIGYNAYQEYEFRNNPLNRLTKYESKAYPGELPEFTGSRMGGKIYKGKYQKVAEDISKEIIDDETLYISDMEDMFSKFIKSKREFEKDQIELKKEALDYLRNLKTTEKQTGKTKVIPESFTIGDAVKNPTRFTIKEPTYVEPKVNLKKTREFVEGQPKPKIVAKEETLLKDRIRAESGAARDAAVATRIEMRKSFSDKTKSVDDMKKTMVDYIKKELPTNARGTYLQRVAELDTPTKFNKVFDKVTEHINKYNKLQAQSKTLGSLRSKQAFLTKIGEFANVTIRDMKKQLGLEGVPIRKMTEEQLNSMIAESKVRLDFKREKGLLESQQPTNKKGFTEEEVNQYREIYKPKTKVQGAKKTIKEKTKEYSKDFGEIDKTIRQSLSDRLYNLNVNLRSGLRRVESKLFKETAKNVKAVEGFLNKEKEIKNMDNYGDFVREINHGMFDMESAKRFGIEKEYAEFRKLDNDIIERRNKLARSEKDKVRVMENHFPRVIRDYDGYAKKLAEGKDFKFEDVNGFSELYKERKTQLGRELTHDERIKIVSDLMRNNRLDPISLNRSGNFKERKVDKIDPEYAEFYHEPMDALKVYIRKATEDITIREFFADKGNVSAGNIDVTPVDLLTGHGISLVADGKLTLPQLAEYRDVINSRYGNHGARNAPTTFFSNVSYITTMGNPFTSLKNLIDIGNIAAKEGYINTFKGLIKVLTGKSEFNLNEMGISRNDISQLSTGSKSGKALEKTFKIVLQEFTAKTALLTNLEAVTIKNRKLAKDIKNPKEYVESFGDLEKYEKTYGNDLMNALVDAFGTDKKEIINVIEELKSDKKGVFTEFLGFSKSSDINPLSKLEMSKAYNENPNMSILYNLKTYQLRNLNNDIKNGYKLLGSKNSQTRKLGASYLLKSITTLTLFNATANSIIDALLGKEVDISDELWDGFIQTVLPIIGNKYLIETAVDNGIYESFIKSVIPAGQWASDLARDVKTLITDDEAEILKLRSIKNVPVVGRGVYNWFGGGVETKERQAKEKATEEKKKGMSKADKIIEKEKKKEKEKKSKVDLLIEKEKASGDEINW